MSDRRVTFRLPTIKALFAEATRCAYPGCAERLVFEDAGRGVRTIAVQIAHIRSAKADGPRHDPDFPAHELNEEANLLLLCGKHHAAVDQNESVFETEELLQWKAAQVAQTGGTVVSDVDIAIHVRSLQSSLDAVLEVFRAAVTVSITGGEVVADGLLAMPLGGLGRVAVSGLPAGERFLSVEVVNVSAVGIDVAGAGIEVDADLDGGQLGRWLFTGGLLNHGFPFRLEGRATQSWHVPLTTAQQSLGSLVPSVRRVRAFADLGDGSRAVGNWVGIDDVRTAGQVSK